MLKIFSRFLKRYGSDSRGTTAIEFALIAAPFLLLLFGVIEGGRLMWTINGVQYAVEDTSRFASLNSGMLEADFQSHATEILDGMFIDADPLVLNSSTVTSNGQDFVLMQGTYTHETILSNFIPGGLADYTFDVAVRKPIYAQ